MKSLALSTYDQHTFNKLEKYGDLILKEDLHFGTQDSYWSVSLTRMRRLVALGLVSIDKVGESTFARLIDG